MNTATLYIIGNGFDLYHKLKTSYADFGEYIKSQNSILHYYLKNYFHYVNLWSDFENVLSTLDIKEVISDNDYLFQKTGDIHILEAQTEIIVDYLTIGLKNSLENWILQIKYQQDTNKPFLNLDKNAMFLTFNYSDTLERIYSIVANNITYLHNKAKSIKQFQRDKYSGFSDDSDIIIGHIAKNKRVDMPKQFKRAFEGSIEKEHFDKAYKEAFDMLKPYYKKSLKDAEQIISNNKYFFNNLSSIERVITNVSQQFLSLCK